MCFYYIVENIPTFLEMGFLYICEVLKIYVFSSEQWAWSRDTEVKMDSQMVWCFNWTIRKIMPNHFKDQTVGLKCFSLYERHRQSQIYIILCCFTLQDLLTQNKVCQSLLIIIGCLECTRMCLENGTCFALLNCWFIYKYSQPYGYLEDKNKLFKIMLWKMVSVSVNAFVINGLKHKNTCMILTVLCSDML